MIGSIKRTPDQQRIKSMQAQMKRSHDADKAERAKQKIRAVQKQLAQVSRS